MFYCEITVYECKTSLNESCMICQSDLTRQLRKKWKIDFGLLLKYFVISVKLGKDGWLGLRHKYVSWGREN